MTIVGGLLLLEALGIFAIGDLLIPIVLVLIGVFLLLRAFTSEQTSKRTPSHTPESR